jgi:hypothetical protein
MSSREPRQKQIPIRGKGYSECLAIVKAMLAAKNNAIKGSRAKLDDFHHAFRREFNKLQDPHWPDRQTSSLVEKYSNIRRDVAKFIGILQIVKADKPKSGHVSSDQQQVEKAMSNFQITQGCPFLYYQCYTIMKDQPMLGFKQREPWAPGAAVASALASRLKNTPAPATSALLTSQQPFDGEGFEVDWTAMMDSFDNSFDSELNTPGSRETDATRRMQRQNEERDEWYHQAQRNQQQVRFHNQCNSA